MATNEWEASQDQVDIAMSGLTCQAQVHGLDLEDEKVQAFIQHFAGIMANDQAHILFLYNIIHKNMGMNEDSE